MRRKVPYSAFAVEFRYPDESADKPIAKQAVAMCTDVRYKVRLSLGLKL